MSEKYVTCPYCNGDGFTIEVEAECCNCPTDRGECCNVPNPIQVQKQCCCENGKVKQEINNL